MNDITSVIKNSVRDQDRTTALVNCFSTWDNSIDKEVIEQGILSRFKAIGRGDALGVNMTRKNLNSVHIHVIDMSTKFTVAEIELERYPSSGLVEHYGTSTDTFHKEELETLKSWTLNNLFH